jgi:hypothetical protein
MILIEYKSRAENADLITVLTKEVSFRLEDGQLQLWHRLGRYFRVPASKRRILKPVFRIRKCFVPPGSDSGSESFYQ